MKNPQKNSRIRPKVIQMDAWTVKKTPEVSIYDEKPTKEESDKTKSYPSGRLNSKEDLRCLHSWRKIKKEGLNKARGYPGVLGQKNMKMTHIKGREEREDEHTKYRKRENIVRKTLKRN